MWLEERAGDAAPARQRQKCCNYLTFLSKLQYFPRCREGKRGKST